MKAIGKLELQMTPNPEIWAEIQNRLPCGDI